MALIESSAPGRSRGIFGRLKDYMLAPSRDPSAIIGEDGEPLPDLVPDSSDPSGFREAVAPRSSSLPKTRLANFAGRFGAVGGIIPTHGASGAQQFFTGLTGGLQANANRDLMLAQQARADKQQWLQQQQQISNAAYQNKRNQLADERQKIQDEQNKSDFEQRRLMNAATIGHMQEQNKDAAQKREIERATRSRPVEWGDLPQDAPAGVIGTALGLGATLQQRGVMDDNSGRVWMGDAEVKARDKLATEKAQRRYPMPKALADQFPPGFFKDDELFTDEELRNMHAWAQSQDKSAPHFESRLGGTWAVTRDPKTGKLVGQRVEGVPGKDPREFAPQRDRIEIAIQDGKAVIVNKDKKTVESIPGSEDLTRLGGPKGGGGLMDALTKAGIVKGKTGAGGGAAPPMPQQLSQADVGKIYTDRNGKRVKVTAVNPKNRTQYKSQGAD